MTMAASILPFVLGAGEVNVLQQIVNFLLGLGASVLIPIILFLVSLAFRVPAGKAFRAAVMIGVGFVGISIVINLFLGQLGPIAKDMVNATGVKLEILDVGWPSAAAIAFGSTIGAVIIPLTVAVNLLMLLLGLTKTIDIDIWNYWHFAFTGAMVEAATGNFWLGVLAAAVDAAIVLKLGDWTAKDVQQLLNMPGISLPHGFSAPYVPLALPVKWVIDRTPLKNIKADPEAIRQRLGVLGEPAIIGLFLGIILAILARRDVAGILQAGVSMAAVMVLLPRVVGILMEGLLPIAESIREWMTKRFPGAELYIGLDSAIAIGHPTAIAASLILVPITIVLAIILSPYNRILPFTDLAVLPFMVCMIVPVMNGNVIHTVLAALLPIAVGFLIGTDMAPAFTEAARKAGFPIPPGVAGISSICDGMNPLTWVLWRLIIAGGFVTGITLFILTLAGAYIAKRRAASKS